MRTDSSDSFERFLLEDVLITLGNLRGALGWLADPEAGIEADALRHGIVRIETQIDALRDRAVTVCRSLRPAEEAAPITDTESLDVVELTLDRILRDAMGMDGGVPEFRSSRAGLAA